MSECVRNNVALVLRYERSWTELRRDRQTFRFIQLSGLPGIIFIILKFGTGVAITLPVVDWFPVYSDIYIAIQVSLFVLLIYYAMWLRQRRPTELYKKERTKKK